MGEVKLQSSVQYEKSEIEELHFQGSTCGASHAALRIVDNVVHQVTPQVPVPRFCGDGISMNMEKIMFTGTRAQRCGSSVACLIAPRKQSSMHRPMITLGHG
jgi:hypothetical protein